MHRLNLKLLTRTFRLAAPYWRSEKKWQAFGLLFLLVALLIGYAQVAVLFNQQSGEFTSALAAREASRFWHSIRWFFLLLVIGVPIDAYYYYVRDKLALAWRKWLTRRFVGRYFQDRGYYRLLSKPEIDNPDQRIADDIYSFTSQSLGFVLIFANALLQLIAFGSVLWSISIYLVLFLFVYAAVLTAITFRVFGERLVRLHTTKRKREADFRFNLVRVRENAESIALYRGEVHEKRRLQKAFARLFETANRLVKWSLKLNFVSYSNSYLTMVLPTLIIAPRVLSGELEVGRIVEATGAFSAILSALTLLLDNLDDLSVFAAGVGRLETLQKALAEPTPAPGRSHAIANAATSFRREHADRIHFENFTLRTPVSGQAVVRNLNLSLEHGESLMIVGASGLGKSSLLRAIAGLWTTGEGLLAHPKEGDMMFLPQHAYLIPGTLRAQLTYPSPPDTFSDEQLRVALEDVNLPSLLERCGGLDQPFDFERVLSLGERQRLAFARVLLNQPRFVLLDEATSALDQANETALYEKLAESASTIVSVSHHPSLSRFHTRILELRPEGRYRLRASAGVAEVLRFARFAS